MLSSKSAANTRKRFRVIDLFSGAGGTARGFVDAGFEIVGALDNDAAACKTYFENIKVQPLLADLRDYKSKMLLQSLNLKRGEIDVLVGCPPCQGFTRMRNGNGTDDPRNDLVLHYLRFVAVIHPRCVVFENVPGIIRQKHGKELFDRLCLGLRTLGYGFNYKNPGKLLNAADYGVPQVRKRLVLLAGRDGHNIPYPSPTHGKPNSPDVLSGNLAPWRTVGDAFADLPALGAGEKSNYIANHSARSMGKRVAEFVCLVPHDGGSRKDVPEEFWLDCHKKANCGHSDVYGRLSLAEPSGVITSGCTNVSKGRFVHPLQNRGISFREAARLQGFPDRFVFKGNFDEVAMQIGNAVPPPLAKAIGNSIKQWLDAQDSDRTLVGM